MRIALNLLYLIPGAVGGTQTYAQGLIDGLAAVDTENEYTVYVAREAANMPLAEAPNVARVVCPVNAVNRGRRYLYEQTRLYADARGKGADLLHSLGYVGPIAAGGRHVVTIHDVNYVGHGAMMSAGRRGLLGALIPAVARRAAHVITASEFSRREIERNIGLESSKITVTYYGGARRLAQNQNGSDVPSANFAISDPYIVAVSGRLPHKNIPRLVDAFGAIAHRIPHRLVLIGHATAGADFQAQAANLGIGHRVLMTGYVPDECMASLLGGADLFVFPSLYEGFGLPVLEAQAAGVPVACSTAGSLPEIAGEGAEFFDASSTEQISQSIVRILADPALQRGLAARGAANVRRFTWEKTARETLTVYRRVVEEMQVSI